MKIIPLFAILAASTTTGLATRLLCYYTNWSRYGDTPFKVQEDIDTSLCTHFVYAFMGLEDDGRIKSVDSWNDFGDEWTEGGIKRFIKLKKLNPSAKFIIGVGGWTEGHLRFQSIVRNPQKRSTFVTSTFNFVQQYDFDGLEIDWIYQSDAGTPEDKVGFSELLKELKFTFSKKNYVVSIATSANPRIFDRGYDIATLSKYADFINVMSYDLHGSWDGKTGHVAPLRGMPGETADMQEMNLEAIIKRYISKGAVPEKLNVGIVAYGRTFTLRDPNNFGLNAPTTGPGRLEPLPYRTFCIQDKNNIWKKFRSDVQVIPYAVFSDQWVGYEDADSLREKVKFAKSKNLGGVAVWSLDQDDFKGACGPEKYPLVKAVKKELFK